MPTNKIIKKILGVKDTVIEKLEMVSKDVVVTVRPTKSYRCRCGICGQRGKFYYNGILASIKYGLSNARTEAVNNKIKLVARMAYGFRNIQNMLDMVMLKCGCYTVPMPWDSDCEAV